MVRCAEQVARENRWEKSLLFYTLDGGRMREMCVVHTQPAKRDKERERREREMKTERERQRETDRQNTAETDRQTHRQRRHTIPLQP